MCLYWFCFYLYKIKISANAFRWCYENPSVFIRSQSLIRNTHSVPACVIQSRYPLRSSSICCFSRSLWKSPRALAFSLSLENSLRKQNRTNFLELHRKKKTLKRTSATKTSKEFPFFNPSSVMKYFCLSLKCIIK